MLPASECNLMIAAFSGTNYISLLNTQHIVVVCIILLSPALLHLSCEKSDTARDYIGIQSCTAEPASVQRI